MSNDDDKSKTLVIVALIGLGIAAIWGWSMYLNVKGYGDDLSATIGTKLEKIALLSSKVETLNVEKGALESNLSDLVKERDNLLSLNQVLETSVGKIKEDRDDLRSASEVLEAGMDKVKGERDELMVKSSQLASSLDTIKAVSEELEASMGKVKDERDESLTKSNQLASSLNEIKVERDSLNTSLASAQSDKARMEIELKDLFLARDRLDDALDKSRAEQEQLKSELDNKIKAKELELADFSSRIEGLNSKLTDANEQITNLEQSIQVLQKERDQIKSQRDKIEFQFAELKKKLEQDLQTRDVTIEQLKNDLTVIQMGGDILFDIGSVRIKDTGLDALSHIAATLNEFPDRKVSLEGHTDALPITSDLQQKYASNWELSAARAANAVRYLQTQGVDPARLRAIGYGEYRPVADNTDVQLRSRNRRLEIRLLPSKEMVVEKTLGTL